jgi:hypothetical protein
MPSWNDPELLEHSKGELKLVKSANKEIECSGDLHTARVSVELVLQVQEVQR